MRVLMTDLFLPESTYTLELVKELCRYVDLTVFCKKSVTVLQQDMQMKEKEGKTERHKIEWKKKFYSGGKGKVQAILEYGKGLYDLEREIRKGKYDVVHVHTFKDARYEIPLYCRTKKYCRHLIHTVHNLLPHEAEESDRKLYSEFYDTCDLLIVHNEYCKKLLMEDFKIEEKKIRVIPHGSYTVPKKEEMEKEAEKAVKSGQKKPDRKTFLQFGIIRKYKGVDILLEAVSMIPESERQSMHFMIAGVQFPKLDSTDYRAMIKKYHLEDCVELRTSHVPDEEVSSLFAQADFCLFPYRDIYGSGALLMAYSYEKPVLASAIPAFIEETDGGKTGILFESENPEALKDAILKMQKWSAEEYQLCQSRISQLVHEKYNWASSAEKLWEAYQE